MSPTTLRTIVAQRWQIPLLGAALFFYVLGTLRMQAEPRVLTLAQVQTVVKRLESSGQHANATALLARALKQERPSAERGELHRLLADAIARGESALDRRGGEPALRVVSHYRAAMQLGASLTADDRRRLGEALSWGGEWAQAADVFREALKQRDPDCDSLVRRIIEWMDDGRLPAEATEQERLLDAILTGANTDGANLAWALDRRVARLLLEGKVDEAETLVRTQGARLAGTPHRDEAAYLRAACTAARGAHEEAEAMLRELRSAWQPRDGLWARVTRLLGEIHLREDRPQAALTYFDDVLKSFRSGAVFEACLLGRAECLVVLDRFREAADTLEQVVGLLERSRRTAYLDRDAVRAFLRTSAQVLQGRRLEGFAHDAVRFFEMSQRLLEPGDRAEGAFLADQIATLQAAQSRDAAAAGDLEAARRHALAAGDAFARYADLMTTDADEAGAAVLRAADQYESAGRPRRAIPLMEAFVAGYPQSARAPAVLRRLGQAHCALGSLERGAAAYRRAIDEHRRTLDAMQSVVPLARTLMALGGDARAEAEALLIFFVDQPPGTESLVTPQAPEFGDALETLAELYVLEDRFEEAVARFEDAVALFPDDARSTGWRFRLAECYRRSSEALAREATAELSGPDRAASLDEARFRMERALALYGEVVRALAAHDVEDLTALEQTRLRAAFLYRGDCLFDLERYDEAAGAYAEAVWRYENEPASVVAAMQVVQCYLRLGARDEARRSLERVRWLLRKIPDSAFRGEPGMPERQYWQELADRLVRSGLVS